MSQKSGNSFFSLQDSPLEKFIASVLRLSSYVGMSLIVAMMFLTVVHGFGRYGFSRPVPGLVELSGFMLASASLLLVANTQVTKGHVTIGLIIDRISERKQAIVDSLTYILCLTFSILALWRTIVQGLYVMQEGDVSGLLGIPHYPFVFVLAFGWGLFSVAIAVHLFHFINKAISGIKK